MLSKHRPFLVSVILHLCTLCVSGQKPAGHEALLGDSGWSYHFQFTGIEQGHYSFHSPYSGGNSLQNRGEQVYSVTSTVYIGRKLWKGAALYFNPEMAGGKGLSSTRGIAGFPNGETFRIGDPTPAIYIARLFLRQHFFLDKDHFEEVRDDANQVTERVSRTRITITAGKFSLGDFFDDNGVSHDPRMDFMNWALMNNGAYDYAANTRGYTYGLTAEYVRPGWTLRLATALEPTYANGPELDGHYMKTNSENLEWEKKLTMGGRKGVLRLLAYYNVNKAPNYDQAVAAKLSGTDTALDAIYGKRFGSKKYGFGVNVEQELGRAANAFLRAGWNDGKTASWAFAEIDNSISGGLRIAGPGWHRKADNIGIALLSNGISAPHRNFLSHGGYGFMIGDGKLPDYGRENIAELFYESMLFSNLWATLDYQFVVNPAYNRDRGPVHVLALRIHLEF
ncbi:MAG: carbohydrate porin [Bacteroidota bacterium]|nr:carbohydrate porin [Bacteroidota bacterium]MDP4248287.1 carbohydrate porin [Bacteroidota bacterium]MDP4252935.1 carbohydrate porin [Bacteroidota bacterium]MDP4256962.1 carbohydrate porin [Bacteroidota bacterium]